MLGEEKGGLYRRGIGIGVVCVRSLMGGNSEWGRSDKGAGSRIMSNGV
jgi:hypothetical protein